MTKQRINMSKAHLAELLNVSPSTLRRWLNKLYLAELEQLGYTRKQQLFTPRQWCWLVDKLVITDD